MEHPKCAGRAVDIMRIKHKETAHINAKLKDFGFREPV